ncbi:MAG: hypothetical protein MHM6MM_002514 [Cercozoa sp. M6MM]
METAVKRILSFATAVGKLKRQVRTGWALRGVNRPESVAEHSFRMAAITLALGDSVQVDRDRVMRIALVHDLAEAVVGDIPPESISGVSKAEKQQIELNAMRDLCLETFGCADMACEVFSLWREYEESLTPEAQLVKDFDKIEMILQASEYEVEENQPDDLDLADFYHSVSGRMQTPLGKALLAELVDRRDARNSSESNQD